MTLGMARHVQNAYSAVDLTKFEEQLKKGLQQMGLDETAAAEQIQQSVVQIREQQAKVGTPEWLTEQCPIRGSNSMPKREVRTAAFSSTASWSAFFAA